MDESTLKCFSLPKNFAYNKKLFLNCSPLVFFFSLDVRNTEQDRK